jgi:hypothetical protein
LSSIVLAHITTEGWRQTQGADAKGLILSGNATGEFVTLAADDNTTTLTYSFFTFSQEEQVSLGTLLCIFAPYCMTYLVGGSKQLQFYRQSVVP